MRANLVAAFTMALLTQVLASPVLSPRALSEQGDVSDTQLTRRGGNSTKEKYKNVKDQSTTSSVNDSQYYSSASGPTSDYSSYSQAPLIKNGKEKGKDKKNYPPKNPAHQYEAGGGSSESSFSFKKLTGSSGKNKHVKENLGMGKYYGKDPPNSDQPGYDDVSMANMTPGTYYGRPKSGKNPQRD
jgi:hypothetical protein